MGSSPTGWEVQVHSQGDQVHEYFHSGDIIRIRHPESGGYVTFDN